MTSVQKESAPNIESSAESIRQEHIKHEAAVKSIGALYYLGAFLLIVMGISLFVFNEEESYFVKARMAIFLLGLGALQLGASQIAEVVAYPDDYSFCYRSFSFPNWYTD